MREKSCSSELVGEREREELTCSCVGSQIKSGSITCLLSENGELRKEVLDKLEEVCDSVPRPVSLYSLSSDHTAPVN